MALQRDPLTCRARQQVAKASNGGVASVRADKNARCNGFSGDVDLPSVGLGLFDCTDGGRVADIDAEFLCARHEQIVKKTALDRDLAFVALRKIDMYLSTANGDEFYGIEISMRQRANAFEDFEPA